jgi:dihydrofolate reductase
MEIIIIVAVADNYVIGNKNDIPWRIKEDFLHFKQLTMGHPCIMGDRTFESLPQNSRPLPGRENIVLSLNKDYKAPGAKVFGNWESAIEYLQKKGENKVYICGGASIYRFTMKYATMLELTRVHMSPEGDTKFPELDWSEWKLLKEEKHKEYTFQTYKRIQNTHAK